MGIIVSTFVVYKPAIIWSKLWSESSVRVNIHGLALLVDERVFAALNIIAEWAMEYEYL